jgi:hypothetical protein
MLILLSQAVSPRDPSVGLPCQGCINIHSDQLALQLYRRRRHPCVTRGTQMATLSNVCSILRTQLCARLLRSVWIAIMVVAPLLADLSYCNRVSIP